MNTTSYEEILRQHQWETHVPLNRADGESVSVRYCRECDAEMLLTHDETGFELAVIYRPPGAELWFVRSSGQDPMRPVNRGEYEEETRARTARTGRRKKPFHWTLGTEDHKPATKFRPVPKEETPPYREMLELHQWNEDGWCDRCLAVRTKVTDASGDIIGLMVELPGKREYYYLPSNGESQGELEPASLEDFTRTAQIDYMREEG